jgi:DJ-1/PfpI family
MPRPGCWLAREAGASGFFLTRPFRKQSLVAVYVSLFEYCIHVGELVMQDKYDILVIPGGAQGAATISKSEAVQDLVREFIKEDKIVGMICAGASSFFTSALYIHPVYRTLHLGPGSLTALTSKLPHQPLTSHPSVKSELEKRTLFPASFNYLCLDQH